MIVKVQVSLSSPPRVLVYNRDRSVQWEGPLLAEVWRLMRGRLKAFFAAEIVDTVVQLDRRVVDEDW